MNQSQLEEYNKHVADVKRGKTCNGCQAREMRINKWQADEKVELDF